VNSIAINWLEINEYRRTIGPGKGGPARPSVCPLCDGTVVWFNGWRVVFAIVLQHGLAYRFDDGLPVQRVKCAQCKKAWTLRPPWLYPRRQFQLDVVENATINYLQEPRSTHRGVARSVGCAASSVWRWVGECATVAEPAAIVADTTRMDPGTPVLQLIPKQVPQTHQKARSDSRAQVLLLCLQLLTSLGCWSRALPHPSLDPSPLRRYVWDRFLRLHQVMPLRGSSLSPRLQQRQRGPPAYH
jgi:hypothetical protein